MNLDTKRGNVFLFEFTSEMAFDEGSLLDTESQYILMEG